MADDQYLENTEELFSLLQGTVPKGCVIPEEEMPNLDAERAWTVIWWLGNKYWQVSDAIERCDSCGSLYDSDRDGMFREADEFPGRPSGHRCGNCDHDFDEEAEEGNHER